MLEFETKHKRGKKTLFFIFLTRAWKFLLLGIGIIFLSWLIYAGPLNGPTTDFLAQHPTWTVDAEMLSLWLLLLGISFILFGYLEANVHYRNYKFILDEYALHIHRGLFFIHETTIPYQSISNVHIARPYHYRFFGIVKLDIVTASERSIESADMKKKKYLIPVIDKGIARQLARQLLQYAAETRHRKDPYLDDEDEDYEDGEDDEQDSNSEA